MTCDTCGRKATVTYSSHGWCSFHARDLRDAAAMVFNLADHLRSIGQPQLARRLITVYAGPTA
jgi:hypothetical protein